MFYVRTKSRIYREAAVPARSVQDPESGSRRTECTFRHVPQIVISFSSLLWYYLPIKAFDGVRIAANPSCHRRAVSYAVFRWGLNHPLQHNSRFLSVRIPAFGNNICRFFPVVKVFLEPRGRKSRMFRSGCPARPSIDETEERCYHDETLIPLFLGRLPFKGNCR